jgi:hypothetical protein
MNAAVVGYLEWMLQHHVNAGQDSVFAAWCSYMYPIEQLCTGLLYMQQTLNQ